MYIPQANRETRVEVLHGIIREHSFGTLVSCAEGELVASHLPFLLESGRGPHGTLLSHMARANPQWEGFRGGAEVMALFQGPHAYISPSWYQTPLSVPTWNYVAVHAYGVPRLIEPGPALFALLERLVDTHEAGSEQPWSMERLPAEFVDRLINGIVGVEIPIARLEGKLKLSQNRTPADREGVVATLTRQGQEEGVRVARLMESVER